MVNPAVLAAGIEIFTALALPLVAAAAQLFIAACDKAGFDLDTTGRRRQTLMLEEQIRSGYGNRGWHVNIAIWNMHLKEDHHFNDILVSGISRMGAGGGFRIVIFLGSGHLVNRGDRGFENWLGSGDQTQQGNRINFLSRPMPRVAAPQPPRPPRRVQPRRVLQPIRPPTKRVQPRKVSLTSVAHGNHICAEDHGSSVTLAPHIKCWEHWQIISVKGNKIALKSIHDNYLSASNNGSVNLAPHSKCWEHWQIVSVEGNKIALKSIHGNYLCASTDGSVNLAPHSECWEHWTFQRV